MKHEECCRKLIKAIDAYIAKQDDDISENLEDEGYVDADWTMEQVQDLEDNLAAAMNVDTGIISEQLEESESLEDFIVRTWEVYQNASALADDIQEIIHGKLSNVLSKLVTDYLHQSDMELMASVLRARTVGWAAAWSEELGQIMKLNSHQHIGSILTSALANGKSVAWATQEIMDAGIRKNYWRARSTALTEMLTAHSVAAEEALQQSPVVSEKEWRHTGSRRNQPRPNHVAMDGQVVPKDQPFELDGADGGSYKPMYPRDTSLPASERVNCHCIHRGIVSEEILGLSLEERKKRQQAAIDADDKRWAVEVDEQNKAKSGLSTYGKPVNSLLPNANGGILKPTKTQTDGPLRLTGQMAGAIIDRIAGKGGISRYIFDQDGKIALRIDNSDHFQPKEHPFGNGGAHYCRPIFNDDGTFKIFGKNRCLTAKMRRLCRDIITEYPDMILKEVTMLNPDDFIYAVDDCHNEVYLDYNGEVYIVSESMGEGPNGEPLSLTWSDGKLFAHNANGILNLLLDGKPIRSLVDSIKML